MKLALLSGAHVHTPGYLKTIKERDDLELAVVWDDMPSRGEAIAQDMGCAYEPDLAQAVQTPGVAASIICADNAGHRKLVEASCAAGLQIFCEKPMALSVEDADAMLAAIRGSGVKAIFGFFQPYNGAALAVRKLVAEGGLGEISQLTYRNSHHAAYGRWFDRPEVAWFTQPEKAGGGAFCDMGAHAMHFVRLVFGPVSSVSAVISNKSGQYPDVDDHGIALCTFANGATGVIEASWVFTGGPTGLEVIGSQGSLTLRGGKAVFQPFVDNKPGEARELAPLAGEPTHLARLLALIQGDLDAAACDADLDCCRDAVAISVAAYASSASGERVAL
ncbi:MAG: Gfo/Idh/MocA family oxidoreductase [Fimbriimonadaceae bacterium]|nr:Gfo/Idh/MocA family oxidoreductase [Fimbriimonadaceae bacterium]